MGYRYDDLAPGEIYHICTRAVERRNIFLDRADHERVLSLLVHCLPQGVIQSYSVARRLKEDIGLSQSGEGLVDLLAYCVMDNHLHLLIKENTDGGTSLYMQRVLNSYAKYFNLRYKRSGPLFTGRFKAVLIDDDEQLLHVSRYIHLNPFVAHIIDDPLAYEWSSLGEYVRTATPNNICHTKLITDLMSNQEYKTFITDEADYARAIADTQHLLLDYDG